MTPVAKRSKKAGVPPGTLIPIGDTGRDKVKITVIDYDESQYAEKVIQAIDECIPYRDKPTVTWINVDGVHRVDIIEKIGECFGVHGLLLEDIVTTDQRPKMEDLGDYMYIVLRMLYLDEKQEVNSEQVSVVFGPNYVISFQETERDLFRAVRERIRDNKGRIRKLGADYLAYSLIDVIVDNYFLIMETLGEKIEAIEMDLISNPVPRTLRVLHNLKRTMVTLRRSVWPLREVVSAMSRSESALIKDTTEMYLKDVYDHTVQVIDTIESYRDILSGMMDIYLSSVSNRLNEVMKVLTIIATIFIPLTFLVGVYGMNLKMPEAGWPYSYAVVWGIIVAVAVVMIILFKRKRWI